MKKFMRIFKKLVLVAIIGFVLWFLGLVALFLFYGFGGLPLEMPIPAEALMNKTKDEILQIAFAEDAPRIKALDNKVNITYLPECKEYKLWSSLRFDDIEDARFCENLMESNNWDICQVNSIWTNGRHSWRVTFKDGKVEKVEKVVLREFSLL